MEYCGKIIGRISAINETTLQVTFNKPVTEVPKGLAVLKDGETLKLGTDAFKVADGKVEITVPAVEASAEKAIEVKYGVKLGEGDVKEVTINIAKATVKVEKVNTVDGNYVAVKITVPKEDLLAQTVKVKNGAGVVVPVKPLDVAAGDKTAEFEFVTPVKAADLKGVWTVNGKEYDLDVFNNLSAFLNAGDQLALNKALTDLWIRNVDIANMPAYFTTKEEDLDKTAYELTVADVQKLVDDVNAKAISADDEKTIVKAVVDAKKDSNQVALLRALQNRAFVRVNPEWVSDATNGYMKKITGTETAIAGIQNVINNSNDAILKTAGTLTTEGIDRAKLTESKSLIESWATVDKDGKITDANIKTYPDKIKEQLAVADVAAATTPTTLKNKLTALAGLVDDTKVLDMKNYVDANGKAYIAALAKAKDTDKDTTTKINNILFAVNDQINSRLSIAPVSLINELSYSSKAKGKVRLLGYWVAVNVNNDNATPARTVGNTDSIVIELYNGETLLGKQSLNATGYENHSKDISIGGTIDAYGEYESTSWNNEWYGKLTNIPTKAVATVTYKDGAVAKAEYNIPAETQTAAKNAIETVLEADLVKAINNAKSATEVKAALDNLAITSYVNVPSVDKMYISEQVFAAVEVAQKAGNSTLYANKGAVVTALDTASTGIIAKYDELVKEFAKAKLTNTAATVEQLGKLGYDAFDNLTPGEKALVAEKFVANYPVDKDEKFVDYTTLNAVKAAIDAAIK